jgi:hypothetical protein
VVSEIMAGLLKPMDPLSQQYRGLGEIFEFTNWDGRQTRVNCGQAAACTLLTHHGMLPRIGEVMLEVERAHPPDNLGGYLGTSRCCVRRICRAFGLKLEEAVGESTLRSHLASSQPVLVTLGVPGPRLWRWQLPVGHWMVAYGFDDSGVYLTNWGRMGWDEFRAGWQSFIPGLVQMRRRGLTAGVDLIGRQS